MNLEKRVRLACVKHATSVHPEPGSKKILVEIGPLFVIVSTIR